MAKLFISAKVLKPLPTYVALFTRPQQFSEHEELVAGLWKIYTKSEEDNLESEHLQKIFFDNHICISG